MTAEEEANVRAAIRELERAKENLEHVSGVPANGVVAMIEPLIRRCQRLVGEDE